MTIDECIEIATSGADGKPPVRPDAATSAEPTPKENV